MSQQQLPKQDKTPVNHTIFAKEVICLDSKGIKIGLLPTKEAIKKAKDQGLDLVQITFKDPPVCKILDYGKYKYEQSIRNKENAKKQRENEIKCKEVQFRPVTDENDLKTKAKHVTKFLEEGFQVKLNLKFKGREINNSEIGQETLLKFLTMLPETTKIVQKPNLDGKNIICVIKL